MWIMLHPQNLPIPPNPSPEMISHNPPPQHRLLHNALDMSRFNASIPDPLPSQRIRPHPRRDVDNHIARVLVPADMADQPDVRVVLAVHNHRISTPTTSSRTAKIRGKPPGREYPRKLGLQHGRHDPAAQIAPAVSADENHGRMMDVDCGGQFRCQARDAGEFCALGLGEGGFLHGMEFGGEEECADECG